MSRKSWSVGFVIPVVGGKAEGRARTGVVLALPDNAATGRLGAKSTTVGFRDTT